MMTTLLILFSIILYFVSKHSQSKTAIFLKKYRSIIITTFGVLILFIFNNGEILTDDLLLALPFILIGLCYFEHDFLSDYTNER